MPLISDPGPSQDKDEPPPPSVGESTDRDARNWAMFCHLAALAIYVGIPFGNILGPLVVWLIKKDEYVLVDREGKKALNFQITMTIAAAVCIPLVFVLIGAPLLFILVILNLVFVIIAAVKTSDGKIYEYPFSFTFIK